MAARTLSPERERLVNDFNDALFHLVWRLRQQADQRFAPFGLNSLRALVLGMIARERMHPKAIAEALDMAPPAVSHLLTELEQKGLIARSLDQDDRRRVVLELTEHGEGVLSDMTRTWNEAYSERLDALTDEEAALFVDLVRRVTEAE